MDTDQAGGTIEHERLLARTALFRQMTQVDLRALASRARERPMRTGEVLFRRGDSGTGMLVILTGRVRIVLPSREGREQVLRILQPGEVLGELALLDGRSRTADAVAESNGRLLMIERRELLDVLRTHPDLALAILTLLSERLRATNWLLEAMLFHDAAGRLALTLLMLAQGQPGGRVDITQGALSERIGTARETVNKKLREWQAQGMIALEPGRVTVLDRDALRLQAPPSDLLDSEMPAIW
jgi:CRP-like cAMP-binding protein